MSGQLPQPNMGSHFIATVILEANENFKFSYKQIIMEIRQS